jgi:CRISPR-associated protein Cmr6
MAGGVMENAGLCLDRFGLPYIPGSAVKGCARRWAIQTLLDARGSDESSNNLARHLASLALVFGCSEQDWGDKRKDGRFVSDFAFAIGDKQWREIGASARKLVPVSDSFGGYVSYMSAYPVNIGKVTGLPLDMPETGQLELDVVTCHHGDYYANPDTKVASDTEEPVPVIFPAVAAGHVFTFAVLPLRDCTSELLSMARTWLVDGLKTFGLGAKTAAGYGWFEDVSTAIRQVHEVLRREREQKEQRGREQAERDVVRASLQPDLDLIDQLRRLKEPDLRGQINPFATEERFWTLKDERVQLTILYYLCVTAPDLFTADRAKPSSKIAKAITHLSGKFPHIVPAKP